MPAPRITRKNQSKWLFAFLISILATALGLHNLSWGYQQMFDNQSNYQSNSFKAENSKQATS